MLACRLIIALVFLILKDDFLQEEEESSTKQSELEARIEELVKSEKTSRMMEV